MTARAATSRIGMRKTRPPPLPTFLRPLFWEYDFRKLSWKQHAHLVTGKILARGDWRALVWLRRKLGDPGLREWIIRGQGRGLSRRQVRYWELILDLPHRLVNQWLADPGRRSWDDRLHA